MGYGQLLYGAALSGLLAGTLAWAWNAILRAAHREQFCTDAPLAFLPVSWQDTGSDHDEACSSRYPRACHGTESPRSSTAPSVGSSSVD